jgi:transposase
LREKRHEVHLIPAQLVRPFVKSNKDHSRDAEAIAGMTIAPCTQPLPVPARRLGLKFASQKSAEE